MKMEENQLQLVTEKQAIELKKLDFNYPCLHSYTTHDKKLWDSVQGNAVNHNNLGTLHCSAPTIQHALKWLRQEQDIDIWITHYANTIFYQFSFIHRSGEISGDFESGAYDDYEEAEREALDYAIAYLSPVDDGHL